MIAGLNNEKGVTLLEVLATAIIIGVALISLYTGIMYADKQLQRNYHDRVATLHASGELDWQTYYYKNYKEFDVYNSKTVVIDKLYRGRLLSGQMKMRLTDTFENPFGTVVPYKVLEISVSWVEPGDKNTRKIVVREDYY
jgi:prepilin-type N-terminal cleavage/methylation domain-containing protein